jgi:hypothetical protein
MLINVGDVIDGALVNAIALQQRLADVLRGDEVQAALPNLMVPEQFKQTFRDWAEGRVNFTAQG